MEETSESQQQDLPNKAPAATDEQRQSSDAAAANAPSFKLFPTLTLQPASSGSNFLDKTFLLLQWVSPREDKEIFSPSV